MPCRGVVETNTFSAQAVSQADYDAWVSETQTAGRYVEPGRVQVAASE